jgi:hypothetical protein
VFYELLIDLTHFRFGERGNLSSERIQMVSFLLATQYSTLRWAILKINQ